MKLKSREIEDSKPLKEILEMRLVDIQNRLINIHQAVPTPVL